MTTILGRSIPPKYIRADQCGDWRILGDREVWGCAAEMEDWRSEVAVIIHEVIEALLCQEAGVWDAEVTAFDENFERERAEGKHSATDEAGDDPNAPYREQHGKATMVEMAVCVALGLDWDDHEKNVVEATTKFS